MASYLSRVAAVLVTLVVVLVLCTPAPAVLADEPGRYLPDLGECARIATDIGELKLGSHVGSLCSKWTMWWPGNERRCCQTVLNYVGEGGELAFCLCDPAAALVIREKLSALSIDSDSLPDKCLKHDVQIPFNSNDQCPPPRPAPTSAPAPEPAPRSPGPSTPATTDGGPPAQPAASLTPTQAQCAAAAEEIGQSALISSLASCFVGATDSCCSKATDLLGAGGALEFCVCDPQSIGFITTEAEKFGIDVVGTLRGCLGKGYSLPAEFNQFCPPQEAGDAGPQPPLQVASSPAPVDTLQPEDSDDTTTPRPPVATSPTSTFNAVRGDEIPARDIDEEAGAPDIVVSLEQCISRAEEVGQEAIIMSVAPCLAGPIPECCSAALALVGADAPLQYCLCDREAARFITDQTDELNFDLQGILDGCLAEEVPLPFFGNQHCPAGKALVAVIDLPDGMDRLPTDLECADTATELGQATLLGGLAPCLNGPSEACCQAAETLAGPRGDLAFCLCNQSVMDEIASLAGQLQLGVDMSELTKTCSHLPVLSNGNCPDISETPLRSITETLAQRLPPAIESSNLLTDQSSPSVQPTVVSNLLLDGEDTSTAPDTQAGEEGARDQTQDSDGSGSRTTASDMPGWVIAAITLAALLVGMLALTAMVFIIRCATSRRQPKGQLDNCGIIGDTQPTISSQAPAASQAARLDAGPDFHSVDLRNAVSETI